MVLLYCLPNSIMYFLRPTRKGWCVLYEVLLPEESIVLRTQRERYPFNTGVVVPGDERYVSPAHL